MSQSTLPAVDLDGRVALVAGGGRGIGRAVADGLCSAGAEVMVADRGPGDLERTAARLPVATFECDFADAVQVVELFAAVRERLGRLDVLVCAQGLHPGSRELLDIPFDEYRQTQANNLDATFLCVQQAARAMAAGQAGGRIVVVTAMNALASRRGAADYDASQAGLHGLVKAAAIELAPERITVNAIVPGWVRTEVSEEELESIGDTSPNPSGIVGEPEDVARAALWLIDPDNAYVTGSAVVVDGGQTAMLSLPWREGR